MDLIYMDHSFIELGVLKNFELDLDVASALDFALLVKSDNVALASGYYWYIDGTEYGGKVDQIKSVTDSSEVTFSGRNWRGILASKIIEPPTGSDYRVVSGTLQSVTAALLSACGVSAMFVAAANSTAVSSYQFDRYVTLYAGLLGLAAAYDKTLDLGYANGTITIAFVDPVDYSDTLIYSVDDKVNFIATQNDGGVNHLICLGSGELSARMVIHLYADADGNISQTQTLTGLDEITEVYDYSSVESADALLSSGTAKLKELLSKSSFEADVQNLDLHIGDVVGGSEPVTGIAGTATISNIIVKIKNGILTREYKVG